MSEMSKGWRRSIGLVIAAMALVSAFFWLRSMSIADEIELGTVFERAQVITSFDGDLQWSSWKDYPIKWTPRWRVWGSPKDSKAGTIDAKRILYRSPGDGNRTTSRYYDTSGDGEKGLIRYKEPILGVIETTDGFNWQPEIEYRGVGFIFSYWTIVVPLTLLAACLLLVERPKVKRETKEKTDSLHEAS